METSRVIVASPAREQDARLGQRAEQRFIEQFIAQAAVEAFDESVLDRLVRRDVMSVDPRLVSKAQDRVAGKLRPIVADDHFRLAAFGDQAIELSRHTLARQRHVGDEGQVFTGAIVNHRENPKALPIGQLVGDKIEAPALVWRRRDQHWRTRPERSFAAAAPPHSELFLAVKTKQPLVVDHVALPPQQHMQPTIAKASAFMRDVPRDKQDENGASIRMGIAVGL